MEFEHTTLSITHISLMRAHLTERYSLSLQNPMRTCSWWHLLPYPHSPFSSLSLSFLAVKSISAVEFCAMQMKPMCPHDVMLLVTSSSQTSVKMAPSSHSLLSFPWRTLVTGYDICLSVSYYILLLKHKLPEPGLY